MDLPTELSGPSLDSEKEVDTPNTKVRTSFKKVVHRQKWMVSQLTYTDKLGIQQSNFASGQMRSGSDGYYRVETGLRSTEYRIESKCGTQYIQGIGMVAGKTKKKKAYLGEL